MEEIREKLGRGNYSDLADEDMLSDIIERKAAAPRNKNLLVGRFWETTAKMMDPGCLHDQELGGLVGKNVN